MASGFDRLASGHGLIATASWLARLARDAKVLASASDDTRLASDDRTGYVVTNFYTKNPNFHHV